MFNASGSNQQEPTKFTKDHAQKQMQTIAAHLTMFLITERYNQEHKNYKSLIVN
jgi:hypothetical protein